VGAGGQQEKGTQRELKELKGMSKEDAESLLQGPEGNSIVVVSLQDGKRVEQTYMLRIPEPDMAAAKVIDKDIGYIKLPTFMSKELFVKLFDKGMNLDVQTPGGLQGVVLDLRNNGGGLVSLAKELISFFLRDGVAIHEKKRTSNRLEDITTSMLPPEFSNADFSGPQLTIFKDLQTVPLVILINGSSASASEIVTGALKEARKNTIVIGKRSFGKGVEMSVIQLANCARVAVTSAQYTTPSGQWLHNVGIKPDIEVSQPRDLHEDAQLVMAVKVLHERAAANPSNVVQMTDKEVNPVLGPVPERTEPRTDIDWKQIAHEHRVEAQMLVFGLISALVLLAFLLVRRRKR
jgi:carboxyl-terminal processing protease